MNKASNYKRFNPSASAGTCCRCKETKDGAEFHRNPGNRNGLQSACKACMKAEYRADAPRRIGAARMRRWMDTRVRLASDARCRDRKAGRVSDIEAAQIRIPEACPITGKPLWHGKGERMPWSPALVRIDKSRGYVTGNWRVVSWESVKFSGMTPEVHKKQEGFGDLALPVRVLSQL